MAIQPDREREPHARPDEAAETETPPRRGDRQAVEQDGQGTVRRNGGQEGQQELAEVQDAWRRALADLDNLRKRYARELEQVRQAERARTAAQWLPVLDHLELALAHARAEPSSVIEGVEAVRDQAVDVLERLGYPRQEESGVPFDPSRHEVVSVVDDPDAEPGTVVEVLRPGYGDDGSQLRPMAVTVSRRRE
ncbi:nucleotide exchange factor GrpE [Streptomyces sp. GMY02]|uniref:nucleotide exchange factor GrpE n=1 Tax=Streptomyces sp. GMY02 TaxID=1333528 RepID=UPI001C2BFA54|nr:nucleotide exchange factor GrpE [Streptomyces sp. GMY02]QXE33306.1 nucleotide exchange factor GrpE [Streptomyces sp. GMY02]